MAKNKELSKRAVTTKALLRSLFDSLELLICGSHVIFSEHFDTKLSPFIDGFSLLPARKKISYNANELFTIRFNYNSAIIILKSIQDHVRSDLEHPYYDRLNMCVNKPFFINQIGSFIRAITALKAISRLFGENYVKTIESEKRNIIKIYRKFENMFVFQI